jgi:hypothetical protein
MSIGDAMDDERKRQILDEARAHLDGTARIEPVRKREPKPEIIRKTFVTERADVERQRTRVSEHAESADDPWRDWNDWAEEHVRLGIEAEREFWREVLARMLARLEDQFAEVEKKIDALETAFKRLHERSRPTIDARTLDPTWQKLQAH